MDDKTPAIIQARLGSTRLPGKALLRLGSRTALERVVTLSKAFSAQVILATSTSPEDDPLRAAARDLEIPCVRGPLEDVHARYRLALALEECAGSEWFFRVTGDCPLLSPTLARLLLAARSAEVDYAYFADDELPRGLAPELVRTSAFLSSEDLSSEEREHVTLALYGRGDSARVRRLEVPSSFQHPELRLTLDYPEDALLLERLFVVDDSISAEGAIEMLLRRPELAALNRHQRTQIPLTQGVAR